MEFGAVGEQDFRPAIELHGFRASPVFAVEYIREALRSKGVACRFKEGLEARDEAMLGGVGEIDWVKRHYVRMGLDRSVCEGERT
jgi:hypothetical protein